VFLTAAALGAAWYAALLLPWASRKLLASDLPIAPLPLLCGIAALLALRFRPWARPITALVVLVVAAVAAIALEGCAPKQTAGSDADGRPSADEDFTGTAGIVEKASPSGRIATLTAVRTGEHARFDRAVFEFIDGELPGYHIEYIDRPVRRCGSGEPTAIAGDGWLEVRLTPAQAHTEDGHATVADRERHLDLPLIEEIELTCDFEGEVAWVLGVSSPNRYRVLELSNPPRLAVDIRHE
jgi:hypothetical protein